MGIVRAADHRRMRWKNGAGETIEFAISPAGASLDNFDWRLSRASVAESGPFSLFPECDRVLGVIDGGAIALQVEGGGTVTLDPSSEPYRFAADVPVHATLIGDPVSDLNLIWRRGKRAPVLTRHRDEVRVDDVPWALVLVLGRAELRNGDVSEELNANDLVICSGGDRCTVIARDTAPLYRLDLAP